MAFFGDTTQGGSSFPCSGGRAIVGRFELTEAGTVSSVTVFFASGQSAGMSFRGLIYADSGGNPGALLGYGASVAVPGTVGGELESVLTAPLDLSPGFYWIGSVASDFQARWSCDAGIGGRRAEGVSFSAPSGPWSEADTTGDRISAYATYTTGGGGDPDADSDSDAAALADAESDALAADLESDSDAAALADLESDAFAADLESDRLAADLESDALVADAESDSDAAAGAGGASAAAVWGFVLGNGKTAGETLVELHSAALAILAKETTAEHVAGGFSVGDILRILAAVAVGKTTITSPGAGSAFVTFRSIDDALDVVEATMSGSERVSVTLDPTETS